MVRAELDVNFPNNATPFPKQSNSSTNPKLCELRPHVKTNEIDETTKTNATKKHGDDRERMKNNGSKRE